VVAYEDEPEGIMETSADGNGRFVRVTLRPRVHINKGSAEKAKTLHRRAHELCFIANSVNFPVAHEATVEINV
jgi:organic hydroperoxide reductase OsmC/OhrA